MANWTIRRRILCSFAAILVLMLGMSIFVHTSLRHIQTETQDVDADSLPSLSYSFEIMTAWLTDYTLTQQYLLQDSKTGQAGLETRLHANQANLDDLIGHYTTLVNSPAERSHFNQIKAARLPYLRIQKAVLALAADGKVPEAEAMLRAELDPALETAEAAIQGLVGFNKDNAAGSIGQIFGAIDRAEIGIDASFAGGVLLALLLGYLLLRSIARPLGQLSGELGRSGHQVKASVNDIAATAKEQQATANEIAATTAEISATSKEISATSRELVRTMGDVSNAAEHTAGLAGSGQEGLSHMEDTMRQVVEAASAINAKLAVLNDKAGNINQVVSTITKVADQTNLLSLNAAIEAEKAGEHGRGFGVVAVEIRRLADQTAVATYDIEQTVKEIQSAVSAGVMSMDKFTDEVRRGMQAVVQAGDQLSQIIQQVQAMAPRLESVNEGMQAQATGAEQITLALGQLSEAVQQTAESLRQSGQAIDGLNQVATSLSGGVSRLEVMI